MAAHNELGAWGERIASEYLLAQGYVIHRQDERRGHRGEIDIIAFKDEWIVFVEVKTRRDDDDDDPMDLLPAGRRARMCRAAEAFIIAMEIDHLPRYDIIVINGSPDTGHTVTHYPDAFLPPLRRS